MPDAHRQIPGGAYHNDIAELTSTHRQIPRYQFINKVQISTVAAGGVQMFVIFPIRLDAMGHGGIFPGQRT